MSTKLKPTPNILDLHGLSKVLVEHINKEKGRKEGKRGPEM